MLLTDSSDNIIFRNYVSGSQCGIRLGYSLDNSVNENTIKSNDHGAWLEHSEKNRFQHNNFVLNTWQTHVTEPGLNGNFWDDGYPSGGNYWIDYAGMDVHCGPYQNVTGMDGIGDTPYIVDANNTDRYPLLAPYNVFTVAAGSRGVTEVGVLTSSIVSDIHIDETARTLSINVSGVTGTKGFCKITLKNSIVESFWHGNYIVLMNGLPWPSMNWTDIENTYFCINYTHSEHQILIVPEQPSILVLSLFMAAALPAAMILRSKRTISSARVRTSQQHRLTQ